MNGIPAPDNESQRHPGQQWLRTQAEFDWTRSGLAPFADWDPALVSAMRMIAVATSPMALLIGPRGVLAANAAAQRLLTETAGSDINGRSVFNVLPDSAEFHASILEKVLTGGGVSLRDEPVSLSRSVGPATHWFNLDYVPVIGSDGAVLAALGIGSDVSAHIRSGDSDAMERQRLAREQDRAATEDPLTRVLIRGAFTSRAEAQLNRARLKSVPCGLLVMEIDYFESINQRHGHPGGDEVLATVASRIDAEIRDDDLLGQLGGEEFAVLLPGIPHDQIPLVAERIRSAVAATPIPVGGERQVAATVSIGAIADAYSSEDLDQLLLLAGDALRRAKSAGRDRVVFLGDSSKAIRSEFP